MCSDCVKGEAHMHFLVAASLVSAPRRVDSSLNRWLVLKQLHQASIYLRPAPEWNFPGTLTHRARIEEQSFSCSTLRNELILQQATAARANLTARSLHLRLPGLEKGRPWCFLLLRLPALTHSLTLTRRDKEEEWRGWRFAEGEAAAVNTVMGSSEWITWRDGERNVPLTSPWPIERDQLFSPDAGWLLGPTARPPISETRRGTRCVLKTVVQNISYRLGVLGDTTFLASWLGGVVFF